MNCKAAHVFLGLIGWAALLAVYIFYASKADLHLIWSISTFEILLSGNNSLDEHVFNQSSSSSILVVTLAVGDYWYKPLVRANRVNYCQKHGYGFEYVDQVPMNESMPLQWTKIVYLIDILTKNTTYEWIFVNDIDLFIMNSSIRLEGIINEALTDPNSLLNSKYFGRQARRGNVEMILTLDGNNLNFGSMLLRNSIYTRQVFEEIWTRRHNKSIPYYDAWREQAVFIQMCKERPGEFSERVALIKQQVMNSYGFTEGGKHHLYKRGDFVIHFAGFQKHLIAEYARILLEYQPELMATVRSDKNLSVNIGL